MPSTIERGLTSTSEHMHRCLVRQLLRWRAQRNAAAMAAMKRSPMYAALQADANRQWEMGNRGEKGEWR